MDFFLIILSNVIIFVLGFLVGFKYSAKKLQEEVQRDISKAMVEIFAAFGEKNENS